MPYKDPEVAKAKNREYYLKNKEKLALKNKQWRIDNAEYIKEYSAKYQQEHKKELSFARNERKKKDIEKRRADNRESYQRNKEVRLAKHKEWHDKNPEKVEYYVKKNRVLKGFDVKPKKAGKTIEEKREAYNLAYRININAKIARILRSRTRTALKRNATPKKWSAVSELGCSIEFCREHIESLFREGMSWENHGLKTWHLDHKIPLSAFNLQDEIEYKIACHYTNIRPLFSKENLEKQGANVKCYRKEIEEKIKEYLDAHK